jgi:hypothetical protein
MYKVCKHPRGNATHNMRPVWYSSHCAASHGIMIASVPMTTSGPEPSASVPAICAVMRCTDSASHPAQPAMHTKHQQSDCRLSRAELQAQHLSVNVQQWTQALEPAPWSNSWPSGEELFVRRACLPSRQSRCRYISTAKPLRKYTHDGATPAVTAAGGRPNAA